jgi:hypothetical protein
MDLDPAPDPTQDPTTLFSDFTDAKKIFFILFFLITYQQAHYLQSLKPKADATAQKVKNVSYKRFLEFYFATINGH